MTSRATLVCALLASAICGCAGVASSVGSQAPSDRDAIAAIHTRKCGSCHVPPEPKSRTREQLDIALGRHKNRLRLTPAQWAAMIDFLAASDGSTANQPR